MNSARYVLTALAIVGGAIRLAAQEHGETFELTVLPPECKRITDAHTGAELVFLTTNPAKDTNLYFHERSWLADGSLILFNSSREDGGAMGYIVSTGELVRLTSPNGPFGAINAAKGRNSVFGVCGDSVIELSLTVEVSRDPKAIPSRVTAKERVVARPPKITNATGHTPPSESCDERHLAVGMFLEDGGAGIVLIDVETGETRELCHFPDKEAYNWHVQWSRVDPNSLSYAGPGNQRLMVVDIRNGTPRNIYHQWEEELVTHEHWWVANEHGDDQMIFCGGVHPKPLEDADVKIVNVRTGVVRILGSGAWWPDSTASTLAKRNFWHCSGSEDGRWVAADNWHGDITILEGKTSRPRMLTVGHRTYGHGDHPHVGWDRQGKQVIFASHMLGNADVCVATIPDKWQEE